MLQVHDWKEVFIDCLTYSCHQFLKQQSQHYTKLNQFYKNIPLSVWFNTHTSFYTHTKFAAEILIYLHIDSTIFPIMMLP